MKKPYKVVVKAIIFDEHQRVLVLHRSDTERKTKNSHGFDFPGGGLEDDETVIDALKREVLEETGLMMKVIAPAYIYDEVQTEKHLVVVKFACQQPKGQVLLSDEHDDYEWISVAQLADSKYPEWMQEEIHQAFRIYQAF